MDPEEARALALLNIIRAAQRPSGQVQPMTPAESAAVPDVGLRKPVQHAVITDPYGGGSTTRVDPAEAARAGLPIVPESGQPTREIPGGMRVVLNPESGEIMRDRRSIPASDLFPPLHGHPSDFPGLATSLADVAWGRDVGGTGSMNEGGNAAANVINRIVRGVLGLPPDHTGRAPDPSTAPRTQALPPGDHTSGPMTADADQRERLAALLLAVRTGHMEPGQVKAQVQADPANYGLDSPEQMGHFLDALERHRERSRR